MSDPTAEPGVPAENHPDPDTSVNIPPAAEKKIAEVKKRAPGLVDLVKTPDRILLRLNKFVLQPNTSPYPSKILTSSHQTPSSPRRPKRLPLNLQLHPLPTHLPRSQIPSSPGQNRPTPRQSRLSHHRNPRPFLNCLSRHSPFQLPHHAASPRRASALRMAPPTPARP